MVSIPKILIEILPVYSRNFTPLSTVRSGFDAINPPGVPVQRNMSLLLMDMVDSSLAKGVLRHTNYFVCTLGQAALVNRVDPPAQLTISAFIDKQAASIPEVPAVGFALPPRAGVPNEDWSSRVLSMCWAQTVVGEAARLTLSQPSKTCKPAAGLWPESFQGQCCHLPPQMALRIARLHTARRRLPCSVRVLLTFYSCGLPLHAWALRPCR